MSGLDVPLWKQELLKRKQAKLNHEKLISTQKSSESSSKTRVSNVTNSNSSALNHRVLTGPEKAKTNVSDKNNDIVHNSKKGSSYNRHIILPDASGTRQSPRTSGNVKSVPSVDTGPSRLERFEDTPGRNIGIYGKNYSYSMHGMPQNTRVPHDKKEERPNKLTDSSDSDRLSDSVVNQGVEREHISPRDVKMMWQLQASKDETSAKTHVTKNPALTKREPLPSKNEVPQINTQAGSNPALVPKAYKSPYAKAQWRRPASVSDEVSVKTNKTSKVVPRNDVKSHTPKPSLSNGSVDNVNETEKDGVEHIQSVKSLLGLFGGKARPNINRKVSDNVLVSDKSDKDYRTSEIKRSSSKRPALFKHHSEPNLFFSADNEVTGNMLPTSPKKSPTVEVVVEDALPSHHVSQGIKERMTRLRRASHSSMEEMEGFVEYQNGLNSDSETKHITKNNESQPNQLPINQKLSPQQKDIPEKISVSITENDKQSTFSKQSNVLKNGSRLDNNRHTVARTPMDNRNQEGPYSNIANTTQKHSSQKNDTLHDNYSRLDNGAQDGVKSFVGKQNQQDLCNNVKKNALPNGDEKPRLSYSVNNSNRLVSPVNHTPDSIGNQNNATQNSIVKVKKKLHEETSPESLPVIESGSPKTPAAGLDLTDTNELKSKHKYQSKQNNYAVEIDQSGSGLHNVAVSTKCLTEIKQIKQEPQLVIKNEETSNKKPRRKGLNVVDPLAVLQLTKDPILLKEKPAEAELGVFRQSPSGKVEIIKHEPDKKNQIAQINRAWDLDNNKPVSRQNNVDHKKMPASTVQVSSMTPRNVPVTSIDEIPVSVIDDFASNKLNEAVRPKATIHSDGVKVGNTTFYDGTLSLGNGNIKVESDEEFIPVSSIDSEPDLGPPPEIIFDKMPANLKSSFAQNGKKRGNISFFEHVFIHDYQSETAAASDWDFENGTSFSSYTPAAVKQYEDMSKSYNAEPAPTAQTVTPPAPPEEPRNDEPLITYNEDESVDFTGSSDSTAGALLF